MRVPELDLPHVASSAAPGYTPKLRQADTSIEQGLQAVGQGLSDVVKGAETFKKKADALRVTDSLTAYRHDVNSGLMGDRSSQGNIDAAFNGEKAPTGFLSTRGIEASAQSADVLTKFQKRQQEIADGLNEDQRAQFLERSAPIYESARGSVESHTAQQFQAAQVATTEAAKQMALDAAASGAHPDSLAKQAADIEKSIRALQLSPEDGAADVAKFRKDMAATAITAQIAAGDVKGAADRLETDKETLGTARPHLLMALDEKRKAQAKEALEFDAQALVGRVAVGARNQYGFIDPGDENKIRDAVDVQYPEKQKVMGPLAEHVINVETERRDAIIKSWTLEAKSQRRKGGTLAISPLLRGRLEKYNPDYLDSIDEDDRRRQDRARARSLGGAAARAAEREQKAANSLALTKMQALPFEEQANFEQKIGFEGLGLDEQGIANLQKQQQLARNFTGKGFDRAKESLDTAIAKVTGGKALKGEDPGTQLEIKKSANEDLQNFLIKHGRPPDAGEREEIVSKATLKAKTKPRVLDVILGPGQEFDFQRKKREAAAAAKDGGQAAQTVTVRRKADGKLRTVPAAQAQRFLADPAFEQVP